MPIDQRTAGVAPHLSGVNASCLRHRYHLKLVLKHDRAQGDAIGGTASDVGPTAGKETLTAGLAAVQDRSGGAALPPPVQAKMEGSIGCDFSSVRVHEAPELDRSGALAVTHGEDIFFGSGRYDPTSQGGQELIGHELAHVRQQAEGRAGGTQAKGLLADDPHLEDEADRVGADAAAGRPAVARDPTAPLIRPRGERGTLLPKLTKAAQATLRAMGGAARASSSADAKDDVDMTSGQKGAAASSGMATTSSMSLSSSDDAVSADDVLAYLARNFPDAKPGAAAAARIRQMITEGTEHSLNELVGVYCAQMPNLSALQEQVAAQQAGREAESSRQNAISSADGDGVIDADTREQRMVLSARWADRIPDPRGQIDRRTANNFTFRVGDQRLRGTNNTGFFIGPGGNADERGDRIREPPATYRELLPAIMGAMPHSLLYLEHLRRSEQLREILPFLGGFAPHIAQMAYGPIDGRDAMYGGRALGDAPTAELIFRYLRSNARTDAPPERNQATENLGVFAAVTDVSERARNPGSPYFIDQNLRAVAGGHGSLEDAFYRGRRGRDSAFPGAPSDDKEVDGGAQILKDPTKYPKAWDQQKTFLDTAAGHGRAPDRVVTSIADTFGDGRASQMPQMSDADMQRSTAETQRRETARLDAEIDQFDDDVCEQIGRVTDSFEVKRDKLIKFQTLKGRGRQLAADRFVSEEQEARIADLLRDIDYFEDATKNVHVAREGRHRRGEDKESAAASDASSNSGSGASTGGAKKRGQKRKHVANKPASKGAGQKKGGNDMDDDSSSGAAASGAV